MSVASIRIICDVPGCREALTIPGGGEGWVRSSVTPGTVSRALARANWEEIRPRPGSGRATPYHGCPRHLDVPEADLLAAIERAEACGTVLDVALDPERHRRGNGPGSPRPGGWRRMV